MSSRRYEINTEVDTSGTVAALLFGGAIGFFLIYPALPGKFQAINPAQTAPSFGAIGGALLGGVAMFLLFIIGWMFLYWMYLKVD